MHYQISPYQETKLVRCVAGAIYDVVIDLRRDSPTFAQSIAVELTARNDRMLYIPEDVAHGFQSLEDNTEVFYQISEFYAPQYAKGIRWDDPTFGISWPISDPIISVKDATYPDFVETQKRQA